MEPEKELTRAGKELQDQFRPPREWSLNIQSGPECVVVMAQVLLIVSTKEVMGISLSGEGLIDSSLYANAKKCLSIGAKALTNTGERMENVYRWAYEMGRSGGTVDQMTKYLDPNQSAARNRQLKRYLDSSKDKVDKSVQEISNIRSEFGEWRKFTDHLLRALEATATTNLQLEQQSKNELKMKRLEKLQSEKQLDQEQRLQQEFSSRFTGALSTYEAAVNNLPTTLAGAGAVVTAVAAVGVSVPVALAALVALGIQYSAIDSRRQERTERINRLERETASLEGTLAELAAHGQSLSHLADIVRRSINYLSDLQDKVDMFMVYLINIQMVMDIGAEAGKFSLDAASLPEDRQDKDIKKSIFEKSFQLKASFLFAAKAAELYNNVSSQYIIPGINWFNGLRLLEGSAAGGLEATLDGIAEQRRKICSGAEELAQKMGADLDSCMETLIRETAKSFKEADPELWSDARIS